MEAMDVDGGAAHPPTPGAPSPLAVATPTSGSASNGASSAGGGGGGGDGAAPSSSVAAVAAGGDGFRPELLRVYYGRLFPYVEMHSWLAYGHDRKLPGSDQAYFHRREFSFTLEHDIYVRYQSFKDAAEMETAIREKCPHKIDIGAVYNVDPGRRTMYQGVGGESQFCPVERELVFDVDMTDYDDIRTCCSGASVCDKCWTLMTIAIKVVDRVLRDDFGFEHILWVFSGRRGVHCWVCDPRARRLTNEQRTAITEYLRVYKGSESNAQKVSLTGAALHPSLLRAYNDVLLPYFQDRILTDQRVLDEEASWSKVLAMLPDEDLRERLADKWRSERRRSTALDDASVSRWKQLESTVRGSAAAKKNAAVRRSVEEVVFSWTYPRLDIEVSKHMNHLLKAPFCVHPKTGKVCVPIDARNCDGFSPDSVPTLEQLVEELNQRTSDANGSAMKDEVEKNDKSNTNGTGATSRGADDTQTSLHPFFAAFRTDFLRPLAEACKADLEARHKGQLNGQRSKPTFDW